MIKYKWFYLRILLLTILILYGCAAPPIPRDEIVISRAILSELDKFKVRHWKYIVIHHSASYKGSASSIDRYHRKERGWKNGLGYHFIIGNGNGARNGQIEVGDRWNKQIKGAHAGDDEYNEYGIGICLVGNFDNNHPSEAQISSLIYLIKYLQERCNIPRRNIIMHKNIKTTDCPGNRFPYNKLMTSL
jgi:N-acetylmuramoyl-L-alanine amidase